MRVNSAHSRFLGGANPGRQLGACSGPPLCQTLEACLQNNNNNTCFWAAAAPQLPSTLAMGAPLGAIILCNSPEGGCTRPSLHCIPLDVTRLGHTIHKRVSTLCLPCNLLGFRTTPTARIPPKNYASSLKHPTLGPVLYTISGAQFPGGRQ